MSNITIRRNSRSRHLRLSIYPDSRVVVSAPFFATMIDIEKFVSAKINWIQSKLKKFAKHPLSPDRIKSSREDFIKYKEIARKIVKEKIEKFNAFYKFKIGNISIKNQKTRWGSCSRKGNININYKIALLPDHLANYLIVHELCHIGQFNHSQKFWDLVGQTIPDYKQKRKELRGF